MAPSAALKGAGLLALLGLAMAPTARAAVERSGDDARIAAAMEADLAAMQAATAADLVEGGPRRALVAADMFTPPHGDGRGRIVLVGLAPGAPGELPVPTGMEYLRYTVRAEAGKVTIFERPARADLVTAVTVVLEQEGKAMAAADAALTAAKVALPAGAASWKQALQRATYDARLPRERFVGEPGWQLIFAPWDEAKGGWTSVLLGNDLRVTSVNRRRP